MPFIIDAIHTSQRKLQLRKSVRLTEPTLLPKDKDVGFFIFVGEYSLAEVTSININCDPGFHFCGFVVGLSWFRFIFGL